MDVKFGRRAGPNVAAGGWDHCRVLQLPMQVWHWVEGRNWLSLLILRKSFPGDATKSHWPTTRSHLLLHLKMLPIFVLAVWIRIFLPLCIFILLFCVLLWCSVVMWCFSIYFFFWGRKQWAVGRGEEDRMIYAQLHHFNIGFSSLNSCKDLCNHLCYVFFSK